jgi:hypothetical protein
LTRLVPNLEVPPQAVNVIRHTLLTAAMHKTVPCGEVVGRRCSLSGRMVGSVTKVVGC